jgi:hypothetical protein
MVRTHDEDGTNVQYDALYLAAAQGDWPQIHDGYMKVMTEWGEGTWDIDWMMEKIA